MYYVVIELPRFIWGLGENELEALYEANFWYRDYTGNRSDSIEIVEGVAIQPGSFVMRRCSHYFFEKMRWTNGWEVDPRFIEDRVLFTEELDDLLMDPPDFIGLLP